MVGQEVRSVFSTPEGPGLNPAKLKKKFYWTCIVYQYRLDIELNDVLKEEIFLIIADLSFNLFYFFKNFVYRHYLLYEPILKFVFKFRLPIVIVIDWNLFF